MVQIDDGKRARYRRGLLEKTLGVDRSRKSVWERIQKAGLTEAEVGYLWMDDSLGLILDKLDALGIADNTIVALRVGSRIGQGKDP